MADAPATFSESWYRVAGQRLALRPNVRTQRQTFRGERWIVLQNPLTNQFFRLRPEAYEFVARLGPDRTVEEVWRECLERAPDSAPGQEAVIQLLAQLYHANLLQYQLAADTAQVFQRFEKTRQREFRSRLLNIMFARFPLLDPDPFLVRTLPLVGKFISALGAVLWLAMVGWGLKIVADNFPALRDQAQGLIAPDNLFLLYLGLIIVKTLHEFGHAYFCRRFGGEVHVMGILLMIFTPVPYMDATAAWGFRERWKRMLVGAAGMIVELLVAAVAAVVWSRTGQGTVHSLAYNIMMVASVSTLVFNLNPLLRFDGYYILSDLLGIPNLNQRANRQLRYWAERHLFGLRKESSPAHSRSEAGWLGVFGIASGIYRVFVFGGILLVIADRFLLIGLIMAAVCAVAWIAVPTIQFIRYLAASPKLDRHRIRAVAVSTALAAVLVGILQFVPFPAHFRAPGVIRSQQWAEVHNPTSGYAVRLLARPGEPVEAGRPLLEMANPELDLELARARAAHDEVQARIRQALQDAVPNLKPLESVLESTRKNLQRLEADRAALTVTASQSGVWVGPALETLPGRWLPKGSDLGLLVDPTRFQFHAIVRQEDGDRLFSRSFPGAEVRLPGQAHRVLAVGPVQVIPAERQRLPSPALGWQAGGPVATAPRDPEGRQAVEPFFELRGDLVASAETAAREGLQHGRAGRIRLDLPHEPLLPRWIRALRQLLQKRYQV